MAGLLLETKIRIPARRGGQVARPSLVARLRRGAAARLTLVSAPAGFGKTTLVTEWLAAGPAQERSVAWLSLDHRDNDPAVFWTYLVAALQQAVPGVADAALSLLRSGQAPTEAVLGLLVNDLHAVEDDLVLVLDDYHVIEERDVLVAMAFLLEHLPPQVHLVITSRADPAFALARLRARGELVEVRAADLRFTPEEAAAYLNHAMGLDLTAEQVAALEARTEGWIAALQLAALSMQGRADVGGFIAGFAGDDRYIVDYLVEEVLQRQPEEVRTFLLTTSVLSRLTGPLCDAVTGQGGGRARLEALDRGNLFLVALDDRRQWYRYHHLFADVLRARLLDERPDAVRDLHRRASDWFEAGGDRPEAIGHALAGGHVERAADLVELALPAMRQARQESTLRGWLEALPAEVIRVRPVLSLAFAGGLLIDGELEGVETHLRDVERWLDATGSRGEAPPWGDAAVVDASLLRSVRGGLALYRAAQARIRGDAAGTMTHARRVLDLVGADAPLERGSAAGLLGLAYWTAGDLESGHRWWADAVANLQKVGHHSDMLGCTIALADIRITQGRLRDAMGTYERGLTVATEQGGSGLRGSADMHVGIAGVLCERHDLEAALQHLQASQELGDHAGLPQNRYRWRVVMARVRQAEGDVAGAIDLLDEAERLYVGDMFPDVQPVAAWRARAWILQGGVGKALGWARGRGLTVEDDLSYLREFEHVTVARALLAQRAAEWVERPLEEATGLLDRLLLAAEVGERTGSVIEIRVLQALAHQARGDVPGALACLDRALTLAEPERYVRVFVGEGEPMALLLREAAKQGIAGRYVRRLLATLTPGVGAPVHPDLIEPLIEHLSGRELDVLQLLRSDLTGPDIARRLTVSLNTVRTHTKNIYTKLGVNTRRAAVRRAEELGLLSRTPER